MRYSDVTYLESVIGMPQTHARAFLTVAQQERLVIIVRATGPTCHGLLEEGYDTKGYRIHGKSCDWGPMAGFVMRDPRLNKYGMKKVGFNRDKHREALELDAENQGWKASVTPLTISEQRIEWLRNNGKVEGLRKIRDRFDGHASHSSGISFYYSLIQRTGTDLYDVYFDNSRHGHKWIQEKGNAVVKYHKRYGPAYEPMLAMTNPPEHRQYRDEHHMNAVTGDYDLFAVWPFVGDYNAEAYGDDHRPLGTVLGSATPERRRDVEDREKEFARVGMGWQGTKLGNITPRIYLVCQLINSIVGRHVLWHSDEAARPFLDDVDLPLMAFTPVGMYLGIENIADLKDLIYSCERGGIKVTLSDAWAQNPTAKHPNRLGAHYDRLVPADGVRIVVPDYYNR